MMREKQLLAQIDVLQVQIDSLTSLVAEVTRLIPAAHAVVEAYDVTGQDEYIVLDAAIAKLREALK